MCGFRGLPNSLPRGHSHAPKITLSIHCTVTWPIMYFFEEEKIIKQIQSLAGLPPLM